MRKTDWFCPVCKKFMRPKSGVGTSFLNILSLATSATAYKKCPKCGNRLLLMVKGDEK